MPWIDQNQRELVKGVGPWALLGITVFAASLVITSSLEWEEQSLKGLVAGALYLAFWVVFATVHVIRSRLRTSTSISAPLPAARTP